MNEICDTSEAAMPQRFPCRYLVYSLCALRNLEET